MRSALLVVLAVIMGGCDRPVAEFAAGESCAGQGFKITDDFPGARRGTCVVYESGKAEINIHPEDSGEINNSPWYAVRIESTEPSSLRLKIRYHGGDHRYLPKLSRDGTNWQPIDDRDFSAAWFGGSATLDLQLDGQPLWVAGQELILPAVNDAWVSDISNGTVFAESELGKSAEGRSIRILDSASESKEVVLMVGRQHPPEVTGAIAYYAFFEAISGDTELATTFRDRFRVISVPMMNPDGVSLGHWRHNTGGMDLNRDWGPFSQPETQLIRDLLQGLDEEGVAVRLFIDFHSTKRNLMYTQMPEDVTDPPGFAPEWIEAATARLPGFEFTEEPRPFSDLPTSRNYMYSRYGIPSVTFELADEENREAIRKAAAVFAEEFMRLALERVAT